MTRTTNYDLIVVEGSDKVNLLTQMNPNTEKIDEVMKANENSGIQIATELLSGTVHAITRTVPSASMFKFTAVSNYTAGDTFTVDGMQVTALLTSGEALGTGSYIIGSEVLCSLKDTLLTVYTQGGTVKTAEDAEKLGGNLPEYYAKQSELNNIKDTADSASSLSRQNSESINNINNTLNELGKYKILAETSSINTNNLVELADSLSNYDTIFLTYESVSDNTVNNIISCPIKYLKIKSRILALYLSTSSGSFIEYVDETHVKLYIRGTSGNKAVLIGVK